MNKIFIPKRIKVGYQKRADTYTGMLAYVVYFDEKNNLRKEASWSSWRDKKIEPSEYGNVPTEGFVLNKKVGDYSGDWGNHRQAYSRVYDPRGFEFEITVQNLLYILTHTNSIKGKGLEGTFVYGWDGSDLILIPTSSPDYQRLSEFSEKRINPDKINRKTIVLGGTYKTKTNEEIIYLGYYDYHGEYWKDKISKKFFFAKPTGDGKYSWVQYASLSSLIEVISDKPHPDYAYLMDRLEYEDFYSPLDPSKYEWESYSFEQFMRNGHYGNVQMIVYINGTLYDAYIDKSYYFSRGDMSARLKPYSSRWSGVSQPMPEEFSSEWMQLESLFQKYQFVRITKKYLANGKPYK